MDDEAPLIGHESMRTVRSSQPSRLSMASVSADGLVEVSLTVLAILKSSCSMAGVCSLLEEAVRCDHPRARITVYPESHKTCYHGTDTLLAKKASTLNDSTTAAFAPTSSPTSTTTLLGNGTGLGSGSPTVEPTYELQDSYETDSPHYFIPRHTVRSFDAAPLLKRVWLHKITQHRAFTVLLILLYLIAGKGAYFFLFASEERAEHAMQPVFCTQILLVTSLLIHLSQYNRSKFIALIKTAEFWFIGAQMMTYFALSGWVMHHSTLGSSGGWFGQRSTKSMSVVVSTVMASLLHVLAAPLACLNVLCLDAASVSRRRKGAMMLVLAVTNAILTVIWQIAINSGQHTASHVLQLGDLRFHVGSIAQSSLLTAALFQGKYAFRCLWIGTDAAMFSFNAVRDAPHLYRFETSEARCKMAAQQRAEEHLVSSQTPSGNTSFDRCNTDDDFHLAQSSRQVSMSAKIQAIEDQLSVPTSLATTTLIATFSVEKRRSGSSVAAIKQRMRKSICTETFLHFAAERRAIPQDDDGRPIHGDSIRSDYIPWQLLYSFSPRPIIRLVPLRRITQHFLWPWVLGLLYVGGMAGLVISNFFDIPHPAEVHGVCIVAALIGVSIHVSQYSRAFVLHLMKTFDFWFLTCMLLIISGVDAYKSYKNEHSIFNAVMHTILTIVASVGIFCMDATTIGHRGKGFVMLGLGLFNCVVTGLWQINIDEEKPTATERLEFFYIMRIHVGTLGRSAAAALAFFELKYGFRSLVMRYDVIILTFMAKESTPPLTEDRYEQVPSTTRKGFEVEEVSTRDVRRTQSVFGAVTDGSGSMSPLSQSINARSTKLTFKEPH